MTKPDMKKGPQETESSVAAALAAISRDVAAILALTETKAAEREAAAVWAAEQREALHRLAGL